MRLLVAFTALTLLLGLPLAMAGPIDDLRDEAPKSLPSARWCLDYVLANGPPVDAPGPVHYPAGMSTMDSIVCLYTADEGIYVGLIKTGEDECEVSFFAEDPLRA